MILKAYYAGGRIDVFDTDHLVDGVPQPGNLLTNYTLDLADVNGESLWLRSYYYEAAAAYKEEPGPTGLPVARRRDGWSFLIADEDDLGTLNLLTVDGLTVLARIAGELADIAALTWVYDQAEGYASMAMAAHRYLSVMMEDSDTDKERKVCNAIGIPLDVYRVQAYLDSSNRR